MRLVVSRWIQTLDLSSVWIGARLLALPESLLLRLALGALVQAVASWSEGWAGSSSSEGIAVMLSPENMRLPSSCQCSSCSSSTAPTRRVIAASLGKMPTTRVRRLISSLTRSSRLVLQTFL